MACVEKKPKKGILKNSSSFDKTEQHLAKEMKWDEMNIIATHHPPDKDYGHMKIDEPPTPYSKYTGLSEEEDSEDKQRRGSVGTHSNDGGVDADTIASRLTDDQAPKVLRCTADDEDESSDDDRVETEEERAARKEFEKKRKLHYNEFQAMKLAQKLMEQDQEDEEEDDVNMDEVAKKNAMVNARHPPPSSEGETSMDISITPVIPDEGTPVDRIVSQTHASQ